MTINASKLPICLGAKSCLNLQKLVVAEIENYIDKELDAFNNATLEYEEIDNWRDEEGYYSYGFSHYKGIADCDYDLKELFNEWLPTLHRRSCLLTIFGVFEHEIENICSIYGERINEKISVFDIRGSGIERCNIYLKIIADFSEKDFSKIIKNIQELRNACAHQDGKFLRKNKPVQGIMNLINDDIFKNYLSHNNTHVIIHKGFLDKVIDIMAEYIQNIENCLEPKKHTKIKLF